MKSFPNVDAKSVKITFPCPNSDCKCEIEEEIEVPNADYSADHCVDSEFSGDFTIICPECGQEICGTVFSNMYEGNIEIKNVDDSDIKIEVL